MSADSSSECTQEEMAIAEVKIEPETDSDSQDPLSVVGSETSCDPPSPADNSRHGHKGDPLTPTRTAATRNDLLHGKQTSTNVPDDEDSMSDLIEETSEPQENPLSADQAPHNVPTLIGLLGQNGMVAGNRVVLIPKALSTTEAKGQQSPKTAEDVDSTGANKVAGPFKKYTCLRCGFQTDFDNELRDHMKTQHPEGLRNDYQKKTQKDAITKPLKCFLCNTYFPKESMLNVHLARQHPDRQVEAEKAKSSKSQGKLRFKLIPEETGSVESGKGATLTKDVKKGYKAMLKTGLKRLACDQCKFITTKYSYLRKHQRKLHSERTDIKHLCEHCNFSTSKYEAFVKHQKKHEVTEKRTFACNICEFSSSKKSRLKQHKRLKHGVSPDSEQCDSTTGELDANTKDAESEVEVLPMKREKIPFITGDT